MNLNEDSEMNFDSDNMWWMPMVFDNDPFSSNGLGARFKEAEKE